MNAKNKFGKKGVSPIIATVLIILITIAAAAIIAGFVVPFVKKNLNESTECLDFEGYYEFKEKMTFEGEELQYNCFDVTLKEYGFSILSKKVDGEKIKGLEGFNLVLYKENKESIVLDIREGKIKERVSILDDDEEILSIPKQGELITYIYDSNEQAEFKIMEIYPIIKGKTCEKSDEIEIIYCKENIIF